MLSVQTIETGNTEKALERVAMEMRGAAVLVALRKSLKPARDRAKALCPKGGPRIGVKGDKKHLRDTITVVTRDLGEVKMGLMGAAYPAGAHAHLVEFGHNIVRAGKVVGRAPPQPFMRPAVEQTKNEQNAIYEAEIARIAAEASK